MRSAIPFTDEIREWTEANHRARNAYAVEPIAACAGVVRVGGERVACSRFRLPGHELCRRCKRDRDKKVLANRERRARLKREAAA